MTVVLATLAVALLLVTVSCLRSLAMVERALATTRRRHLAVPATSTVAPTGPATGAE